MNKCIHMNINWWASQSRRCSRAQDRSCGLCMYFVVVVVVVVVVMLGSSLWGRKWSSFLPHRESLWGRKWSPFLPHSESLWGRKWSPFLPHRESLWGRKRSFFLPHRDRPQDITTSIKHCNIQCFLFPPRTKQRYLRCFLFREHQNRVKTLVFTMFWQQPKTQV